MGVVKRRRSRSETEPIKGIGAFGHKFPVLSGRYTTQSIVRPVVVVIIHKFLRNLPYFIKVVEQISVQYRLAVGFVESLDVRILSGLSRLYILKPYFIHFAPFLCYFGHKLRTIVHADGFGFSTPAYQMLQYPNNTAAL